MSAGGVSPRGTGVPMSERVRERVREQRRREQRRRRVLVLGIAGLILLAFTPVLGHHAFTATSASLAGVDHIGQLCLIALHEIVEPVHDLAHLLLAAGVAWATWDRARAWRRVRRTLGPVEAAQPAPDDPFWTAAAAAGVDPARVRVVDGLPVPAFTVGWWRPAIYVAADLAERLSPPELAAVLAHEGAHVARRDPLRLSALRFLAHTLFWLPVLRRLADDVADEAEILADDAAVRALRGRSLVLASALVSLARGARGAPSVAGGLAGATVGFVRLDLLDRRVRRLAGEDAAPRSHLTRRSTAGAMSVLTIVWLSGLVLVHPMPAAGMMARHQHCLHPGHPAASHLFCRHGTSLRSAANTEHCPHAGH